MVAVMEPPILSVMRELVKKRKPIRLGKDGSIGFPVEVNEEEVLLVVEVDGKRREVNPEYLPCL